MDAQPTKSPTELDSLDSLPERLEFRERTPAELEAEYRIRFPGMEPIDLLNMYDFVSPWEVVEYARILHSRRTIDTAIWFQSLLDSYAGQLAMRNIAKERRDMEIDREAAREIVEDYEQSAHEEEWLTGRKLTITQWLKRK